MSFRTRLTWFFIVIVIVPMIAVGIVLFQLVADSERGKSDARLGQAETSAQGLFRENQRRAAEAGRDIGQSEPLAAAIESGDRAAIGERFTALAGELGVAHAVMTLNDAGRFEAGRGPAVAPSTTALLNREGEEVGQLEVAVVGAQRFAEDVANVTGLEAIIVLGSRTLASTVPGTDPAGLPARGKVELQDRTYSLTSFTAPAFGDERGRVVVRLLADERDTEATITSDSLLVAALLVAFLVLAFAFALTVSRSLQSQIQRLLIAARRLGTGEFDIEVPTEGNDEFAELGSEFNAMARQLEGRLADLQVERTRLQEAIRRVGESFAKGLNRDALLEIVVQTAVDGIGADCGRATVREHAGGPLVERARVGDVGHYKQAIQAVEAAVLDVRDAAETNVNGAKAIAQPLHPSDGGDRVLGVISVARNSRPFSNGEKELFNYLASQAAVSIENVDLHETVQRQAVTDELTGLFNHRRFQEVMTAEVERAKRFNSHLGLIMLDIDNFKSINDSYGHLQGDLVLREVAGVLLDSSREIDEPARYGGEEMAVALPQTDLEGAYQFAERVRQRIEAMEIPLVDGGGSLHVTASFGAAALPESATTDKDALVAAADSALYRAKRAGKNRVVRAQ